jgi:hypothetical protein
MHLKAAKCVVPYVIHTRNYSLKYGSHHKLKLVSYADVDYGSNLIDRKSTTG